MNRVRIVGLGAAALGVAVFAGSQFQALQGGMPPAPDAPQALAMGAPADGAVERPTLMQAGALAGAEQGQAEMPVGAATGIQLAGIDTSGLDPTRMLGEPPLAGAAVLAPPLNAGSVEPGALQVPRILEGLARPEASAPPFAPAESTMTQADMSTVPLDETLEAELNACAVWLVVTPAAGAMLDASVYAPCDRQANVEISHAGLTFDARLGDDGQLLTQIPALAAEGVVEIRFADGRVSTDQTPVTGLADIDRVALQWNAPISVALHAYEFGAQFGEPGHIHAGNPQAPGAQSRGFLTLLGNVDQPGARLAQVYSYPRGTSPRTGQVSLEIEVPVTDASCGQSLQAHAFELYGGAGGQVRAINLEMPACDNAGGYVVLPGVLPDLQIALN